MRLCSQRGLAPLTLPPLLPWVCSGQVAFLSQGSGSPPSLDWVLGEALTPPYPLTRLSCRLSDADSPFSPLRPSAPCRTAWPVSPLCPAPVSPPTVLSDLPSFPHVAPESSHQLAVATEKFSLHPCTTPRVVSSVGFRKHTSSRTNCFPGVQGATRGCEAKTPGSNPSAPSSPVTIRDGHWMCPSGGVTAGGSSNRATKATKIMRTTVGICCMPATTVSPATHALEGGE